MKIVRHGYIYHIKDEFFEVAKDDKLMQNKSSGSRPTLILASNNPDYWWAIPMTSNLDKAKRIKKREESIYGTSLHVVIGKYDCKESAFLLQNMFLVPSKYIDHIHKTKLGIIPPKTGLVKDITQKANTLINLTIKNYEVTYTNLKHDIKFLQKINNKPKPREEYHEHANDHLIDLKNEQRKEQIKSQENAKQVQSFEFGD